jgi:hypothetical protein
MRKFLLFLALFLVCFSLYGQNFRETRIYVQSIDGSGRMADNAYFFRQLIYEVILQYHMVVRNQRDSDYTLKGTIEPVNGEPIYELAAIEEVQDDTYSPVPERPFPPVRNAYGRREFFSMDTVNEIFFFDTTGEDNLRAPPAPPAKESAPSVQEEGEEYYFKLVISDSKTGEVLDNQSIVFVKTDASVRQLISTVVYDMLSGVPEILEHDDGRDELVFFEIGMLWLPRIYSGGYESMNTLNFGVKLGMEFHFTKFFAFGLGAQITMDRIDNDTDDFRDLQFEIPASLKLIFNLGGVLNIEPYGGISWNHSLGKLTQPSLFSWFTGLQFGIKTGSGIIVFDPRFSKDFSDSILIEDNTEYRRLCMQLGIGYKYSVSQKRRKAKEQN